MKIYNTYTINFTAIKNNKSSVKKMNNLSLNVNSFVQNDIYKDMSSFLQKKITKEEYLYKFITNFNNEAYKKLNNSEKKYVHDILTTIDFAESYKSISDEYLQEKMKRLIKIQKEEMKK